MISNSRVAAKQTSARAIHTLLGGIAASSYNRPPMPLPMNGPALRIIDANANRAREGLRVCEDHARFVSGDAALSESLKTLRHDLASGLAPFLPDAILFRDTPGDVGTALSTPSEMARPDIAAVVIAAGKRLGEALRSIEEYLKTMDAAAAGKIESIRYRFYDIEKKLALSLRPSCFDHVRLYVLITESFCKRPWLDVAAQAIAGGADCLQLREKNLESGELLTRARQLADLCRAHDVLCIINDRPDIAVLCNADGVHVGQGDLPPLEARKIVGSAKIVGVSTHDIAQARQAERDGADYIGVGPIFKSGTKPRDFTAGLQYAAQAAASISIPKVAIAGIDEKNVDKVLATGIRAIAVTAAVAGQEDVRQAAKKLKEMLKRELTTKTPRHEENA